MLTCTLIFGYRGSSSVLGFDASKMKFKQAKKLATATTWCVLSKRSYIPVLVVSVPDSTSIMAVSFILCAEAVAASATRRTAAKVFIGNARIDKITALICVARADNFCADFRC